MLSLAPVPATPPETPLWTLISRSVAKQMTGIEWADFTGNPWAGCTRVRAVADAMSGCDICYAETFCGRRLGVAWGDEAPRRKIESFHNRMRRLDRLAAKTGMPFAVFSLSLGDWLDPVVDPQWRSEMIDTVEACPHLTWLLLTHRPRLAAKFLPAAWRDRPPANVWSGVTVDHPLHATRWNHHAEYWAHTGRAWVSAEPLAASLKGVPLDGAACIVLGGASNTDDRRWAFYGRWVDEAVEQYGEERIFFKQYGVFRDDAYIGDKKKAGRDLDGRIYDRTPWPRHRDALKAAAAQIAAITDQGVGVALEEA